MYVILILYKLQKLLRENKSIFFVDIASSKNIFFFTCVNVCELCQVKQYNWELKQEEKKWGKNYKKTDKSKLKYLGKKCFDRSMEE